MINTKLSFSLLYLWLLFWPWSTKLILRPAETNYLEIAFYLNSLFLLALIGLNVIGFFKNRNLKSEDKKIQPLWWWGVMSIFIISTLSIIWAPDQFLALSRWLNLVNALFVFYLVLNSHPLYRERALKFFLLGLIIPALLGIIQFSSQIAPASKYFGLAAHNPSDLGVSVVETNSGRFLRAYGSFDHPNILGGVMALGAILALFLALKSKTKKEERIVLLALFLIFSTALFASFSRAAIFAFALALLALIFSQRQTFWRKGSSFIIGLIILSTLSFFAYQPLVNGRADLNARLEVKSISERTLYLQQAGEIIINNPVRGVGVGNYIVALMGNFPNLSIWSYQPVHNYWLLVWAELGIFGLLAVVLLWFAVLKKSFNNKTWSLWLLLFFLSLFDHWLWTQPAVLAMCLFIACLISASDY
ncbi:MAG: O-antigen ligase family protein [Patescibacteria group bacterium]